MNHAFNGIGLQKGDGSFVTTQWSNVAAAGATTSDQSTTALEQLCRTYWYPLYGYVRRQGHGPEDAQDLTQAFFARMLERRHLAFADRTRGHFRTFLLTSLKHFLINEWSKSRREKRGGGRPLISLDAAQTESRFLAEPSDNRSPDREFDRNWATVLLERVLDRLQGEFSAANRVQVFEQLKPSLTGDAHFGSYAEIGSRLGLTETSIKVTVHRLRRRYLELLREEISKTVEDPESIDDEIRGLFAALNS